MKKDSIDNLEKWRSMSIVVDYLSVSRETVLQWIEKEDCPHTRSVGNGNSRFPKLTNGFDREVLQTSQVN